jgi:hypothetical protein
MMFIEQMNEKKTSFWGMGKHEFANWRLDISINPVLSEQSSGTTLPKKESYEKIESVSTYFTIIHRKEQDVEVYLKRG